MKKKRIDLNHFKFKLEEEQVLRMMDCTRENPLYLELKGLLQKLWRENLKIWEPRAYIQEMSLSQNMCGYACLMTLGEKVSEEMEQLQQEDMMAAFLLDNLANQLIFQMDEQVQEMIKQLCREEHHGISKRMEAPLDYPIEMQQTIIKEMEKQGELPVHLTSAFMLRPEKSMIVFFSWTAEESCMELKHNCKKCPKKDCALRNQS